MLLELFPFVILNGFCIEPFVFIYLEESFIEFHHILTQVVWCWSG